MNELKIINKILPQLRQNDNIALGPGDDCAALDLGGDELVLAAVDQLIDTVHYLPDTPPERAGAKLLKRNLSDIAAMGGKAIAALVSLATNRDDAWCLSFMEGIKLEAERLKVAVCGGDLAALPQGAPSTASLTILGKVARQRICLRSGAKPGDQLFVTGQLGNSFYSEHHLDFQPRLAEGQFIASFASAMIDISDGLLLDAKRLCEASECGLVLDLVSLPLREGAAVENALSDGEDYELLFALPPARAEAMCREWRFACKLTCIGEFTPDKSITDTSGNILTERNKTGYEHRA